MKKKPERLLTINSHEAWIHQLGYLGRPLDVIDGMPGRYCRAWDTRIRPVPPSARLLAAGELTKKSYGCVVAHSVTDLLDLKHVEGPRILVLHVSLEGRASNEGTGGVPEGYAEQVRTYLDGVGGHAVAISAMKAKSWGITDDVVPATVDLEAYPPWSGELAAGIRVANQIGVRRKYFRWDLHETAFAGLPVDIVGVNPDMPGVGPSESWDDLKARLRAHRFYVHTADPTLEDGYNMAMFEAMAAGLPVLGNRHPTSPVEHGVTGFLSDDPAELRRYAEALLVDRELAGRMGARARESLRGRFSIDVFVGGFRRSIEAAEGKWKRAAQKHR